MDCALTEHRGDFWKKDLEFHLVTLLVSATEAEGKCVEGFWVTKLMLIPCAIWRVLVEKKG